MGVWRLFGAFAARSPLNPSEMGRRETRFAREKGPICESGMENDFGFGDGVCLRVGDLNLMGKTRLLLGLDLGNLSFSWVESIDNGEI